MQKTYSLTLGLLLGAVIGFFAFAPILGLAATPAIQTGSGGTGTTSPSGILYGDNGATGHLNTVSIGSNLTFSGGTLSATAGGGGGTGLATSSPVSAGNVLVYTATGAGSAYGVATSTPVISTGLSYSGTWPAGIGGVAGNLTVNASQNITTLSNLTSNGFVKTSGGTGALSIDTSTYLTAAGAVTSLAGTANQITASAATGAVTLSIPTQFNIQKASTTDFSANTAAVGGTATTTLGSDGKITGNDVANVWLGRISPTRSFGLSTGTTTSWTASTTGTAYSPCIVMPFAGTLRQMRPFTDQSFLGINVQIAGSDVAPSYAIASTTVGTVRFTANNTFTAGQKVCANFGTTTTASTLQVGATFDITETP